MINLAHTQRDSLFSAEMISLIYKPGQGNGLLTWSNS